MLWTAHEFKKSTNFPHLSVLMGLEKYRCMCEKSSIKPILLHFGKESTVVTSHLYRPVDSLGQFKNK